MWELIHCAINMQIKKCGQEFKLELLCEKMVGLQRERAHFCLQCTPHSQTIECSKWLHLLCWNLVGTMQWIKKI